MFWYDGGMSKFDQCRQRIERANLHRKAFIAAWNDICKTDSHRFPTEQQGQGKGVIKAIRTQPVQRKDLAFILGEFFYQLRAALDGLSYKAVTLITTEEPTSDNRLDFPIRTAPKGLKESSFYGYNLPHELRNWIEVVQPYNASKTAGTENEGINGAFALINDCARKDRHRKLHVIAAAVTEATGTFSLKNLRCIDWITLLPANLLDDECTIIEFGFSGVFAEAEVKMQGDLAIDISVDEIPGVRGVELANCLYACQFAVTFAVDFFEECFPAH